MHAGLYRLRPKLSERIGYRLGEPDLARLVAESLPGESPNDTARRLLVEYLDRKARRHSSKQPVCR